jgi:DNA gyrase inhibitor GyrI
VERVQLEPVEVMCVREQGDPTDDIAIAKRVWEELERPLQLRGRKFYGLFFPDPPAYAACVALTTDDEPETLGFERLTIPGGAYLRMRLKDEPPGVYGQIGPGFAELLRETVPDKSRPSVEFYRRRDEIDLLLPVA